MHIDRNLTPESGDALPEGYYRVIYRPNPFTEQTYFATFHCSANLAEVIDKLELPFSDRLEIKIEGTHVPREAWAKVRPNAGVNVIVYMVPGVEGAVALLSSLAGSWTANWLASTAFGSTMFGSLVSRAIGAVVSGLVTQGLNKLFGINQPPPKYTDPLNADIRGAKNTPNWYGAVPVVLGTHRMMPLYAGLPYTETSAGSRYLRMLMLWGYGPVEISNVKLGEQRLSAFEDVEEEHDLDGSSGGLKLYPKDADQQAFQILLESADGYWTRTTAVDTTEITVAFTWPNGIYKVDKEGKRHPYQTQLQGQYRRVGGTWVDWFNDALPAQEVATGSAVYRKRRVTGLTEGKYEVRIKRVDESGEEQGNNRINDAVYWTDLNSFSGAKPVNLSGVALSAYRIKANDQINGVIEQLNAVVSLKVPTWNGSIWTGETASSNPAAIFRWILTGPANGNALATSRVDDEELGNWYDWCETKKLEYNRVITGHMSVKDILTEVAAAGFASPNIKDNLWTVVIDKPKSTVVQHFTPRNSWNFSSKITYPDIPHALRLRFLNKNRGYVEDERIAYDVGYDSNNATKFEVVSLAGIAGPAKAWQMGRWLIKSMRLRPEVFSFNVDVEGLVATRGDLIRLTHDVPLIGTGFGRVVGVSGNTVILDERLVVEAGTTYTFRFRQNDNDMLEYSYSATVTEETDTFTFGSAPSVFAGNLFAFGPVDQESIELLVHSIEPADHLSMRLTCIPYQESLYDADEDPDYETVIVEPTSLALMGPEAPTIRRLVSDERAMVLTATGDIVLGIKVFIKDNSNIVSIGRSVPTESLIVRWRQTTGDADEPFEWEYMPPLPVDTQSVLIQGVEQNVGYDVNVQAVGANGEPSKWTTRHNHVVAGGTAPPPAVDSFALNSRDGVSYLDWTYDNPPIDMKAFRIRYHANANVTDWNTMLPMARGIPKDARSYTVPTRSGSYAIKAVDVFGNLSSALYVNASEIDADAFYPGEMITVFTKTEHSTWTGTRSGTYVQDGELRLDASAVMSDWDTLSSVTALSAGAEVDPAGDPISGTYTTSETDLGDVFTSVVTVDGTLGLKSSMNAMSGWSTLTSVETLSGDPIGDQTDVVIEYAASTVDSGTPSYGDWTELYAANITARHIKFRVTLLSTNSYITPSMAELTVTGQMAPRKIADNNVSSGGSTKAIVFDRKFYETPSIAITAQDMQTGDYYTLSSITRAGFSVTFKNSGGSNVNRTFDWVAVGHGREVA